MARQTILTRQETAFLRELVRLEIDFMIVGLSAAALQGAPVVTQDVDLWFRNLADPRIRKALKRVGASYIPPIGTNPPMFEGDNVDLFDIVVHMHGLGEFDDEVKRALMVPMGAFRVPVLPLERIIVSKKATGRQKDRLALPVLVHAELARNRQIKGSRPSPPKADGRGPKKP